MRSSRVVWMKMLCRCALLSLAAMLISCTSVVTPDDTDVRRFTEEFLAAVNTANTDRFVACFAANATAFFPSTASAQRRRGIEQIRRAVEPVFAQGPRNPPARLGDLEIEVDGKLAVVSFDAGNDTLHARRTLILQRTDRKWQIIHLHASNVAEGG